MEEELFIFKSVDMEEGQQKEVLKSLADLFRISNAGITRSASKKVFTLKLKALPRDEEGIERLLKEWGFNKILAESLVK